MKLTINDQSKNIYIKDIDADLETTIVEFSQLSKLKDSFIVLKTNKDEVIQFAWENNDKEWLVDVPIDMKEGKCLQRYASDEDCLKIITTIYKGTSPSQIERMNKVNIRATH